MNKIGKVFILDDDRLFLRIYQQLLEAKGYEVFATDNAYKFILYGREVLPDVFFLDVNMPKMSGWEVLDRINHDKALEEVPVVVLSVNQDEDLADVKGAAHFLCKPLDMEELTEILESYCLGHKDHDILLLEGYEPMFSCCRSIREKTRKSCFCTHDLKGAKKYLKKNKPGKIIVRHSKEKFGQIQKELSGREMFRAETFQDVENLAGNLK